LGIKPKTASTYSALGYIRAWKGELWEAASFLHQALALRRDDTLSREMLDYVVETLANNEEEAFLRNPGGTEATAQEKRELDNVLAPETDELTKKIKAEQTIFKEYAMSIGVLEEGEETSAFDAQVNRLLSRARKTKVETTASTIEDESKISDLDSQSDMEISCDNSML
jgi:hypothetical protein